jgi:hypothetical protein
MGQICANASLQDNIATSQAYRHDGLDQLALGAFTG